MLETYRRLEKEGVIGPSMKSNDGTLVPRPYSEFPKWVKRRDGTPVLVDNKSEEIRIVATDDSDAPVEEQLTDALDASQAREQMLEKEVADLRAKLEALAKTPVSVTEPMTVVTPQAPPGTAATLVSAANAMKK